MAIQLAHAHASKVDAERKSAETEKHLRILAEKSLVRVCMRWEDKDDALRHTGLTPYASSLSLSLHLAHAHKQTSLFKQN
jgi:hypothetical protein